MNFIKNIIDDKTDELTHKQFRRFSKGVFEKRAMVDVRKSKDSYKIKTTFEYLDGIMLYLSENLKEDIEISGTIIGSSDIEGKAKKFGITGEKKNVMGVKKFKLNPAEIPASKLKDIISEFQEEFLLFSIKGNNIEIISKEALPKPGKSDKEGEEEKTKIDFCKITASKEFDGLVKELLFDFQGDFRQAVVRHTFTITDFEVPKQYENDAAKARLYALRVGKIKRETEVDGVKTAKEFDFKA